MNVILIPYLKRLRPRVCQRLNGAARCFVAVLLMATLIGMLATASRAASPAVVNDPAGATTGVATDMAGPGGPIATAAQIKAAEKAEPFAVRMADAVGQNRIAINVVWTLVAGFLVFFMQAGFAMLETGFVRAKNAVHTMMMNFFIYPLGAIGFFIAGFGFMFGSMGAVANLGGTPGLTVPYLASITIGGHVFNLLGRPGWFLSGHTYDVAIFCLFLFQIVFMDTACTIPTGAMAERWKFSSFIVYGFFMSMILYPIFGCWAWGGGWLSQLGTYFGIGNGYVDWAGSGVIHAVGGLCGAAGALVLGPRIGKYRKDGSVNPIPGHHIPMAIVGTLILAFGWFGFNPGSSLGASGGGNLRIAIIAVVTMIASCAGAVSSAIYMVIKTGKPDATMIINGFLAGLVAITAPSGFVNAPGAFWVGASAGVIVCVSVAFLDKIHLDDPVGAVSVHGTCGLWGALCVGLFADGTYGAGYNGVAHTVKGLFYGGGFSQLGAQIIGVIALLVWAFGLSWVFFKALDAVMGIRVSREVEIAGLDEPEIGVYAYPAFELIGERHPEAV